MRPVVAGLDLDYTPGQPKPPSKIKLGFAGATGGATAVHEIRNFSITPLEPKG